MKLSSLLCQLFLTALLLLCFAAASRAQQPSSPQTILTISAPVRSTLYPEGMCVGCIVPQWDGSYLLHIETVESSDPSSPSVTMYDASGKKIRAGSIWAPNSVRVLLLTVGATHAGGILAGAEATMTDGSWQGIIAKTDLSGRTVQSIFTGRFSPHQVCEASDGTVWTLGYDRASRNLPDADQNVLRHYSFQSGVLGSFVSLYSLSNASDALMALLADIIPGRRSLRCSRDHVSLYIEPSAEYIEVDASTEKLSRWKVDMSSVAGSELSGFAVTEDGRTFVSFSNWPPPSAKHMHGLYELKATGGSPIAHLLPVEGTVTVHDANDTAPKGTFYSLYGADGNLLLVQRAGDGWGLSWANVLATSTTPE